MKRLALVLFAASCGSHGASGPTGGGGGGATGGSIPEPVEVPVPITAANTMVIKQQIARGEIVAPYSLTATDGSGLAVSRIEAKAVVEGPIAYTELHLWFHNPENRRREGTFAINLPEHAAVSRFAMESDGQWLEAEVVEKQLARRAYDDFLHRKQDPALLEKAPGNQFTAKVFPIAANADKQIIISFSQELGGVPYALPLRGLPKTAQIDVSLTTTGANGQRTAQALAKRDWQPDGDFVGPAPLAAVGVVAGQMVVASVPIAAQQGQSQVAEQQHALTVLVDTSASRALGYAAYVKEVRELIGKLRERHGDLPLDVIAFDQDNEKIFSGRASGWGDKEDQKLIDRGAAGASDLGQVLAALGAQKGRHVLLIGDGVVTAGLEHAELAAAVKRTGADRLDVVLAGGIRDTGAAGELVRAGLARAGAVLDLDGSADEVAVAIAQPVALDVPVSVAGASWVFPRTLPSARAGTHAVVYARFDKPVAQSVDVAIGGAAQRVNVVAGTEPLVDRALASAEIEDLEAQVANAPHDQQPALKAKLAALSIKHRVISNEASLLVLETDADYERYGIDRKALADILVVGPHGVERQRRAGVPEIALVQPPPAKQPDRAKYKKAPVMKATTADDDDSDGDGAADKKDAEKEEADAPANGVAMALDEGKMGKKGDEGGDDNDQQAVYGGVSGGAIGDAVGGVIAGAPPPPPPGPGSMPVAHEQSAGGGYAATASTTPAAPTTPPAMHVASPTPMPEPAAAEPLQQGQGQSDRPMWPPPDAAPALTGQLAAIEHQLQTRKVDAALGQARDWHTKEPGNVLALIGFGDALEASGDRARAARMYGSIIDLFPGRADMRRFAGERLERLAHGASLGDLVLDTYRRAVVDRPDHLTGRRLYAYALERAGKHADAFKAVLEALDQPYRNDSYAGGIRTLGDDAGLIGASYAAAEPNAKPAIIAELGKRGLQLATAPSTRFILYWETDGNDVDFHIQDARGNHAYYAAPVLASGGSLYADITTGYGPECFAIPGVPKAGPYELSIHYYSQGPMGYGMGLLEIETFDGKGKLAFEDRPYVIMNDHAYVDLGKFGGKL